MENYNSNPFSFGPRPGELDNLGNNLRPLNHDVLYTLNNSISAANLRLWRATCRIADRTASHALTLRYHAALLPFVKNPSDFRNILRLTCSVISGSIALHVLDIDRASTWTPTDLDIYTPNYSAIQIISYLCKIEGYNIVDHPDHYSFPAGGYDCIFHLRRGNSHIDVIQSNTRSALQPIPYFWATHVMNYLTSDSFCIAYPDLTLDGKSLLNPIHLIDRLHPSTTVIHNIHKYSERGYTFRTRPTAWANDTTAPCNDPAACPRTTCPTTSVIRTIGGQ
ncbi:hypothetical protein FKP32DRAFT_1601418 [Trametes sanguinea]|nr:hypothetical protein FKP32DRAFT_1601418 [Trametes sanguinea]